MSGAVKLTVVIPCFNDGPLLKEALASVFAQTFAPSEILVVNDGSTDPQTLRVLAHVESAGIKIIHQENRGLSGARNTGIRNAKGRLLYFLDADNVLYPHCLSNLVQLMQENPSAIAAASRIRFMGGPLNGTEWSEPLNLYILLISNQWDAGIMLRKDAVEEYDLWYDESMRHGYEDWEFHIRLARTGRLIAFHPEPLYQYRVRRGSLISASRKRHVEIVNYIRAKHSELYEPAALLACKRAHLPALLVRHATETAEESRAPLTTQTFQDWAFEANASGFEPQKIRYHLFHAGAQALMRLPAEAVEAGLLALECNPQFRRCALAVKKQAIASSASGAVPDALFSAGRPVALICRGREPIHESDTGQAPGDCDLLIELPDQRPGSKAEWDSALLHCANAPQSVPQNVPELRRRISLWGRQLIGARLHRRCVRLYDYIYGFLVSEGSLLVRQKARAFLGKRLEQILSSAVYGIFLIKPPTGKELTAWKVRTSFPDGPPPLFLSRADETKINLLIATAWLNVGGVEQYILNLCRRLDSSRFRITVATTKASSHPWDTLFRELGVRIYHLYDILGPARISDGLVHLVFNQRIDSLHIVHSREAYEAGRSLKRAAPWLTISDRLEVFEEGGFPQFSARIGAKSVDLRTVSHEKLADTMARKFRLPKEGLRVIYAGTDIAQIDDALARKQGVLHALCNCPNNIPIVAFVGRLTAQKRPNIFVHTVAKILEIEPDCAAHFAVVGDGEMKGELESLIRQRRLQERIHLLGARSDALDLIADATLLMMPSAYEGLAFVSYEAMALGIPQIFANVNGQSELITPETGILINNGPGEESRYARACLDLLADSARRARMATAGKERIRAGFTVEKAVKQYSQLLEELADLSRRRSAEIPHLRPPHIDPLQQSGY